MWLRKQVMQRCAEIGSAQLKRAAQHFFSHGHLCAPPQVVQLLLRLGASPAMLDDDGQTALHHAACGGHLSAVQALASSAEVAELFVCDKYQMTPFHLACENGHSTVVAHLAALCLEVEKAATPKAAQASQMRRGSAVFLAKQNGHDNVVSMVEAMASQFGDAPAQSTDSVSQSASASSA